MFGKISLVVFVVVATFGSEGVATADQSKESKQPPPELAADRGSADPKTELEDMQGTWTVVSAEREGKKAADEDAIKALQIVIKGDSLVLNDGTRTEKVTLKPNPSAEPKSLDLTTADNKVAKGIYELTGDTLKMCWTKDGGERPQEFATKPGSNMGMFILKRDKK